MANTALTPELALDYLAELSTDIRAALVLDANGDIAAAPWSDRDRSARMRELVLELFEAARTAAAGGVVGQVEVDLPGGSVFAVRDERWILTVVTGRFALPSLMFYDLRSVLNDLGEATR